MPWFARLAPLLVGTGWVRMPAQRLLEAEKARVNPPGLAGHDTTLRDNGGKCRIQEAFDYCLPLQKPTARMKPPPPEIGTR